MKSKKIISFFIAVMLAFALNTSVCASDITEYRDVPQTHWAYAAIMEMTDREMFSGTSVPVNGIGTFSPDSTMTRAQFISVLTRYLFPNELSSMSVNQTWYANNYILALKHGLLSSEELDNGDLSKSCSRQEMSMLLIRATYIANGEVATNLLPTAKIADYDSIETKYQPYVLQAFSLGLLSGVDSKGTFNPHENLSRAQAASVIYRLIDPSTRNMSPTDNNISFVWKDGTTYNGEYLNGEANGFGTMTFPNIGTYTGYFVDGKREGLGTFKWDAGDTYIGLWNGDKMHGNGTYKFSDGYTIRGIWANNEIAAEAIYMEPSMLNVEVGTKTRILAKCTPEKITDFISWQSSNTSVVSVDGNNNVGILTAKAVGTATVTAITNSGKTATCVVTVKSPIVQKISLNYGDFNMSVGDNLALKASTEPANAKIEWSSSDTKVASVTPNGYVSAKMAGIAVISAKTENGLIATCYVQVTNELDELWNGTWTAYSSTSYGNKSSTYSSGTCCIDIYNKTVTISFSPFYGQEVDISFMDNYTLNANYTESNYNYELTLCSVNEHKIILELNTIMRREYLSDVVTTNYYVLEH